MSAERTKGPWYVEGNDICAKNGDWVARCGLALELEDDEIEANAAFIVRAANSHEELVAVGKRILAKLDSEHGTVTQFDADDLRSALSKATAP